MKSVLKTKLRSSQLEVQRQQLLQERQQFHMEQLRAAEYRARQTAASQLSAEAKQQIGAAPMTHPQVQATPTPEGTWTNVTI